MRGRVTPGAPVLIEGAQRSGLPPSLALWTWHPQKRFLGSRGILGQLLDVPRFWETPPETRQTPDAEGGRGTSANFGVGSKCGSTRDNSDERGGPGSECVRL